MNEHQLKTCLRQSFETENGLRLWLRTAQALGDNDLCDSINKMIHQTGLIQGELAEKLGRVKAQSKSLADRVRNAQ